MDWAISVQLPSPQPHPGLSIFVPALLLPPRFFFQAFILDVMGLSEQSASLLKTSSCESHCLPEFSSPSLGLRLWHHSSCLGEERVPSGLLAAGQVRSTCVRSSVFSSWVWSGRVSGISATASLSSLPPSEASANCLGPWFPSPGSLLHSGPGEEDCLLSTWHGRADAWKPT